jgi:hypothetical protein
MRTEIVLVSGRMGSGKSTLSRELAARASHNWITHQLIFAGSIYELHDVVMAKIKGWNIPVPSTKDRKLLQLLGTDWGRTILGDNVWVDVVKQKIKQTLEHEFINCPADCKALFVISDCRFRNEFDAFPEALRVRLSCKEEVRKARAESWTDTKSHASEMDLDEYAGDGKFDLYIDTKSIGVQGMTELVLAQLDKGSWKEKRKK